MSHVFWVPEPAYSSLVFCLEYMRHTDTGPIMTGTDMTRKRHAGQFSCKRTGVYKVQETPMSRTLCSVLNGQEMRVGRARRHRGHSPGVTDLCRQRGSGTVVDEGLLSGALYSFCSGSIGPHSGRQAQLARLRRWDREHTLHLEGPRGQPAGVSCPMPLPFSSSSRTRVAPEVGAVLCCTARRGCWLS